MMATNVDVAEWMADQVERSGWLHQSDVVAVIWDKFGQEFLHANWKGHDAISPGVLREFKRLTEDTVVWDNRNRLWRKRTEDDRVTRLLVRRVRFLAGPV